MNRILAVALAGALAGCALTPPPEREDVLREAMPALALPGQWVAQGSSAGPVANNWIASFNDPQLVTLVNETMATNPDLRVAAARVAQAAGYARLAGATLYPQVNVMARGGGKMSSDSSGLQGVGIFLSWEADIWGRVRGGALAGSAQYDSATLDAEYARQSMAALVAKSWFVATEARLQKSLAEGMVEASGSLLSLAGDRLRIGRGDEHDVALARANVQTYRDAVVQLELAYQQARRALELLAGRYPSAVIVVPADLAPKPGPVPAGLPSELMERRPDVAAAERRVAAAFYSVEQAKAAKLPRITLSASGTTVSSDLLVLKNHDNPVWGLAAGIMAPIFQGGALESQVEIKTAEQQAAVADFGRIGSRAFGEVENALASEFALDARVPILRQAVTDNERALELANVRYRVGAADVRAVQQQQLAVYAARTALLRVRGEQLAQRVNLHLALGGGWANETPVAAAAAAAPATATAPK